jgi:hypothetical protein
MRQQTNQTRKINVMSNNEISELLGIEQKIFEACQEASGYDVIFSALQNSITFQMSNLCPACRRNVAKELKRNIPAMLKQANEAAEEYVRRRGEEPPPPQCH